MKTQSNVKPLPGDYALNDEQLAHQLAAIGVEVDADLKAAGNTLWPGDDIPVTKAEPDEPLFTLLARDPVAAHLVSIWSKLRVNDIEAAEVVFIDLLRKLIAKDAMMTEDSLDKSGEAMDCSLAMFKWIKANRPSRAL